MDQLRHPSLSALSLSLLGLPQKDVRGKILQFVGHGHYRYIAGSCRRLRQAYLLEFPNYSFKTSEESAVGSEKTASLFTKENSGKEGFFTRREAGNLHWDAIGRRRRHGPQAGQQQGDDNDHVIGLFRNVVCWAARYGRFPVLEWTHRQQRQRLHANNLAAGLAQEAASGGHIGCIEFLMRELGYTLSQAPSANDVFFL